MSDSLRIRIADALRTMTGDLTYEAMADAVIRELGLRREDDYDKFLGKIMGHRYVTEWETNDE